MGLERAALRVATALALAVLATAGSARAGTAHRDPCHGNHTCPSDHHTYVWRGLVCTSYPDERTPLDTTTVTVGGRTYWCRRGAVPAAASAARPAAATISNTRAVAELRRLPVRPAAPMTGYARARFGPAWADVDGNGCDTRDDVLRRDLRAVTLSAGSDCQVAAGLLHDPYTGKTVTFSRGVGTSLAVQIDHVVALADAWRTGAARWPAAERFRYANDPLVLLAVDGPTNEAKGDDDASQWLPPNRAFDCPYVARQVEVKTKYRLWVTSGERSAIAATLAGCSGGRRAPAGTGSH